MSLAAGTQSASAGTGNRVGAGGRRAQSRVRIHSGGNEVGAGFRNASLEVVRLRATQRSGGAEVAQVVGTVYDGLLPAL